MLRTRVSRMDNRMRSADIYWGPQLGLRILTLFLDLDGLDEGEEGVEVRRPSGLVTDDAKNARRLGLLPIY